MTNADWWARVVRARANHDDRLPRRVWAPTVFVDRHGPLRGLWGRVAGAHAGSRGVAREVVWRVELSEHCRSVTVRARARFA